MEAASTAAWFLYSRPVIFMPSLSATAWITMYSFAVLTAASWMLSRMLDPLESSDALSVEDSVAASVVSSVAASAAASVTASVAASVTASVADSVALSVLLSVDPVPVTASRKLSAVMPYCWA